MSGLTEHLRKFSSGTEVFHEGDAGSTMYFIHQGAVSIEKEVEGATQVLATLQKGDFFGEMSLLDQAPRSATAVAMEDSELLEVTSENFEQLLSGNVEIAVRMIRKYIVRLRETNQRLHEALKLKDALDREIQEFVRQPDSVEVDPKPNEILAHLLDPHGNPLFSIREDGCVVGRMDPATGIAPDVDLTALDPQRSTSRKHAVITHCDGLFSIREEVGVRNGTLVNGKRLAPGQDALLEDGAMLQFGQVILRFSKAS